MPKSEIAILVPLVLVRYVDWTSEWRAILLRDCRVHVWTQQIRVKGRTGMETSVGEDLVYTVEGDIDIRCLRAIEDLRMPRHGIHVSIEDDKSTSTAEFTAGATIEAGVLESSVDTSPSRLRLEIRQPTIAVPARQHNVAQSGSVVDVYADALDQEERATELWMHAMQVANTMELEQDDELRVASVDAVGLDMLVVSDRLGIAKVITALDSERWGKRIAWVLSDEEINASEFGALL